MRIATFNVLADAYTGYGDYSHVNPELLNPGARTDGIVRTIGSLDADIIGLQEADRSLVEALEDETWQTFWTPKGRNKPDGCVTLVHPDIDVAGFEQYEYTDKSGHIAQVLRLGECAFANSHIKWAPDDAQPHAGVGQIHELLELVRPYDKAIVVADCNDRPGGPVRQSVKNAGFEDLHEATLSALVDQQPVALDMLAIRGLHGHRINPTIDLRDIPNRENPSDHVPLLADVEI